MAIRAPDGANKVQQVLLYDCCFYFVGEYEDNGIEKGERRGLFPNICDILPFLWTIL